MNRFLRILLLALCALSAALSQKKTAAPREIFSGTVTELTTESVTVLRKLLTRENETRRFALDAQTQVEGNLRVKARVTVQYRTGEDGQVSAVHIIVR